MDEIIAENEKTWDAVAEQFAEASALPEWGPFGAGEDLNLLPEIKSKTFLEVGCGSGRSIRYLLDQGAVKVYGLDLSAVQLQEAERYNKQAVEAGKVALIKGRMEDLFDIEPVDIVFSVYAIGWTLHPERTLANIFSVLKPGGKFIWSWDHSFFTDVRYEDGKFIVKYAYHDERALAKKDWKKEGSTAHITYRKTSTWFRLLSEAGFSVVGYYEPAPVNLSRGSSDPNEYYALPKAELVPCTFIFVCKKPE